MSRDGKLYRDGGDYRAAPMSDDWLDPGFYKIRARSGGHWIPIEVTLEDGERDPETWELLSDQKLAARWWPRTDSIQDYQVSPERFFARAHPIDRSEFEWLIALRQIRL